MTNWNNDGSKLHLLKTFKAILDQRSVIKAADIRGITQSAASKHLAGLRIWFNDELFVRTAHSMQPTPKALSITKHIDMILRELDLLSNANPFTPALLHDNLVLATTDEVAGWLLPSLRARLQDMAPNLRLTLISLEPDYSIRKLEAGAVNLVISVNWHAPDQLMQKRLFGDRFVCLMSRKHALADKILTIDDYADAAHLMVAPLGKQQGFIDDVLSRHNRRRLVCLSVPHFKLITPELLGDDHIVTLPHRVARDLTHSQRLVVKTLPFDTPMIDYYVFWHRRFTNDSLNIWMRRLIADILVD